MPTRCSNCGDIDYSDLGDMPCFCRMQQHLPQPEPTIEDYCASEGHAYAGDENETTGRCYCGERTYPAGGPAVRLPEEA